jgi:hypothetical protein
MATSFCLVKTVCLKFEVLPQLSKITRQALKNASYLICFLAISATNLAAIVASLLNEANKVNI